MFTEEININNRYTAIPERVRIKVSIMIVY